MLSLKLIPEVYKTRLGKIVRERGRWYFKSILRWKDAKLEEAPDLEIPQNGIDSPGVLNIDFNSMWVVLFQILFCGLDFH